MFSLGTNEYVFQAKKAQILNILPALGKTLCDVCTFFGIFVPLFLRVQVQKAYFLSSISVQPPGFAN